MAENQPARIVSEKQTPITCIDLENGAGAGTTFYFKNNEGLSAPGTNLNGLKQFQIFAQSQREDSGTKSARVFVEGSHQNPNDHGPVREYLSPANAGETIDFSIDGEQLHRFVLRDENGNEHTITPDQIQLTPPEAYTSTDLVDNLQRRARHETDFTATAYPRYEDHKRVTRSQLLKDESFQKVVTTTDEIIREIQQLQGELDKSALISQLAHRVREVKTYSRPGTQDALFHELVDRLKAKGIPHADFLLASDFILDRETGAINQHRLDAWDAHRKKYDLKAKDKTGRRTTKGAAFYDTQGNVDLLDDTVLELTNKTTGEREAGVQDLRAVQLVGDYLLDTYDSEARTTWVDQNGDFTEEGLQCRQDYYELLFQMMRGKVPEGQKQLVVKLQTKYQEFLKLRPQEMIDAYRGFPARDDQERFRKSVQRWEERHAASLPLSGDMDLMLTKGLLAVLRRSETPPILIDTKKEFHTQVLREKAPQQPAKKEAAKTKKSPLADTSDTDAPATSAVNRGPVDTQGKTLDEGGTLPAATDSPLYEEGGPVAETDKLSTVDDSSDETPAEKPDTPVTTPAPLTFEVPKTIDAAAVATYGDIKSRESVTMSSSRLKAEQGLTETEEQYNPKGFKQWFRVGVGRIWKHMREGAYKSRERMFSIQVELAAGISGIPVKLEYNLRQKALDKARERILASEQAKINAGTMTEKERKQAAKWRKAHEQSAQLTDVHQESLKVIKEWREELKKLDNPNITAAERARIENENPLYAPRLMAWTAGEAIADNVARDIVHGEKGEQKFEAVLLLNAESEQAKKVRDMILDRVAKPMWQRMLGDESGISEAVAREQLDAIYRSQEFGDLLGKLKAEGKLTDEQLDLLNSRNYASNLIENLKGIGEQMVQAQMHTEGLTTLEMDINLTLGVAEYGERGKFGPTWAEKRSKKSRELSDLLRQRMGPDEVALSDKTIGAAVSLDQAVWNNAQDALQNEAAWGLATGGALWLGQFALKYPLRFLVPVAGTAVAAGVGGAREWHKLGIERKQHNVETALGYEFPKSYTQKRFWLFGKEVEKKTRRAELSESELHQRGMSGMIARLEHAQQHLDQPEQAQAALRLIIDADARNRLSDQMDINLLKVESTDPHAPDVPFEIQKRRLDQVVRETKVQLERLVAENTELKSTLLGADNTQSFDDYVELLTDHHTRNLKQSVGASDDPLDTKYRALMGELTVQEADTIARRDRIFRDYRLKRTGGKILKIAAIGGITTIATQELIIPLARTVVPAVIEAARGQGWNWDWKEGPLTQMVQNAGGVRGIGRQAVQAVQGQIQDQADVQPFGGARPDVVGRHGVRVETGPPPPLSNQVEIVQGQTLGAQEQAGLLRFSKNIRIIDDQLQVLDENGAWQPEIDNFKPELTASGGLSQDDLDLLKSHGITMQDSNAVGFDLQGEHTLRVGDKIIEHAPRELRVIPNNDGTSDIVLEGLKTKDGTELPRMVLVDDVDLSRPGAGEKALDLLDKHQWLNVDQGQDAIILSHTDTPVLDRLPEGVAQIQDASGKVVQELHSRIPPGTEWIKTGNSYDLVNANNHQEVLLNNVRFDTHGDEVGKILSVDGKPVGNELVVGHFRIDNSPLSPIEIPGREHGASFDKWVQDMGNERGAHGPWGWLEDPIAADHGGVEQNPSSNLAKNLFRGYYEQVNHSQDVYLAHEDPVTGKITYERDGVPFDTRFAGNVKINYNNMTGNVVFRNVPTMFRDEHLVEMGRLMDQSFKVLGTDADYIDILSHPPPADIGNVTMDQILAGRDDAAAKYMMAKAMQIGWRGQVATADDYELFAGLFKEAGQEITPWQGTVTLTEDIVAPGESSIRFTADTTESVLVHDSSRLIDIPVPPPIEPPAPGPEVDAGGVLVDSVVGVPISVAGRRPLERAARVEATVPISPEYVDKKGVEKEEEKDKKNKKPSEQRKDTHPDTPLVSSEARSAAQEIQDLQNNASRRRQPSEGPVTEGRVTTGPIIPPPSPPKAPTTPPVPPPTTPDAVESTRTVPTPDVITQDRNMPVREHVRKATQEAAGTETVVPVSAKAFENYLSSLELPGNAKVTQADVQIQNGKLKLTDTKIRVMGADVAFSVELNQDQAKGIIVNESTLKLNLPALMRPFRGLVISQLGEINDMILEQINKDVDPNWEVVAVVISGNKLDLKLHKKVAAPLIDQIEIDVSPAATPQQRRSKLEELIPADLNTNTERAAWLAGHNKTVGLEFFIRNMRTRLRNGEISNSRSMWKTIDNWQNVWLNDAETSAIAGRYHIPMAFMMTGRHAVALTTPPTENSDGSYTVRYYNPFNDGEESRIIEQKDITDRQYIIYYSYNSDGFSTSGKLNNPADNVAVASVDLLRQRYSLQIPIIKEKPHLSRAKMSLLQTDAENCTLWSIFHAAVAQAMKEGSNQFKDEGLQRFAEDTGIRLLTYEDALGLEPAQSLASQIHLESGSTEAENVARTLSSLDQYAARTEVDKKEAYERSLEEVTRLLEQKDGIVELQDLPTIVIPDLHARRDFLLNVMKREIDGKTVYELLKEGKINVVCVGDGMHSENSNNWLPTREEGVVDPVSGTFIPKTDASEKKILTEYGRLMEERGAAMLELGKANPGNNAEDLIRAFNNSPKYTDLRNRIKSEFEKQTTILMGLEMNRSLGLKKMIMDLKTQFPDNFHYIRGNHDVINENVGKFNNESENVRIWLRAQYGQDFIDRWERFENALPVLVKGKDFVVSHAAPFTTYSEQDIRAKKPEVVGLKGVTTETGSKAPRGLIWTDNTKDNQMPFIENAIRGTMSNLGMPENSHWIIGHRPVEFPDTYRSQFNGRLVQVNSPQHQFITFVSNNRPFDPQKDVIRLNEHTHSNRTNKKPQPIL